MMRLTKPIYTCEQAIDNCISGITGNKVLLQKLNNAKKFLKIQANYYVASAILGELYTIQSLLYQDDVDPIVLGELKKTDFLKIYSNYFVKKDKPGRVIYDAMMAAANEKCPFCGGIGRPRNLDHYLPKAHYPQFSVLPINLIPSCRDCNMDGKGDDFARTEEEQIIHPYLDDVRYFNEQWIFAQYIVGEEGEPGVFKFFTRPPEHWENVHKQRAEKHFNDFCLDVRFSKEAGARFITLLSQIQALTRLGLSIEEIKNALIRPVINSAPFVNYWERVMHVALLDSL